MKNKDVDAMSGKTDERKQGEWKSRYPKEVLKKQNLEAIYVVVIVIISFVLLLLNYIGCLNKLLCIPEERQLHFSRIVICATCGLLGGAIFDMKWFYKSIAHGFWNEDRCYWRIFTPIISLSFAFCLACIFGDSIVILGNGFSAATLGFLSGYFSDEAVGKMAEVAKVLFNTNNKTEENNRNSADVEERE